MSTITIREVVTSDLPTFFTQQLDQGANHMAAFIRRNPENRDDFDAHWAKIMADQSVVNRTIIAEEQVAGYLASFVMEGEREVGYWLGREFWGRGIATEALRQFVLILPERPLHARAAKDNTASLRVLEKCGFEIVGENSDYAFGRNAETEELLLTLT